MTITSPVINIQTNSVLLIMRRVIRISAEISPNQDFYRISSDAVQGGTEG